jgi:dihydroxy-acid dehydratase
MAKSVGVELGLNDFQRISSKVPLLGDLKPSGRFLMEDLHAVGAVPAVMKYLLEKGLLHGDCLTVTGNILAENLENVQSLSQSQEVIRPIENPLKKDGHIRILYGNLAPDGSVAKITGKEGEFFKGAAVVFNDEFEAIDGIQSGKVKKGNVVVIRYEGPKGGPGMPEMLQPTSAIMGAGLGNDVALITDGRFSGGSHGFVVGLISPEAQSGGPLALVEDGDLISIDAVNNILTLHISDEALQQRKAAWVCPKLKVNSGALYKYARLVSSASQGCVTDLNL